MNQKIYLLLSFFVCYNLSQAQNAEFNLQNYHPASPTAFQFLKYTEMPVSEYTGSANISIPLYTISEDGLAIPISLTYHGGGIRVAEEASWVGLGWDITAGSIVQEINDVDDYGVGATKKLPDYNNSPVPQMWAQRYTYTCSNTDGIGWYTPVPVNPVQPYHSYMIATDYYFPINGNFNDQITGRDICTATNYDSEPDIFKANFFGHSLSFIVDFMTGNIVVLNKQGYSVTRNGSSYKILVPSGEEYDFELSTTVTSNSATQGGLGGTSSTPPLPSSKIWVLTKIITNKKRQILFSYSQTSTVDNYPSYAEKWDKETAGNAYSYIPCSANQYGYGNLALGSIAKTFSYSNESRLFLSSITFPNGQVSFITSSRADMLGGQKLDSIKVSARQVVKSYRFNYGYFDASGVGGITYQPSNASEFGNMPNLRLKLLSIQDNIGATHTFSYNAIPLPPKNSFAQDFWGFYNGRLTDTSLIPNPARLNMSSLGDNGNNNSAFLTYAQAGTLMAITYPTGGQNTFEYELNQFNNYWVPDSNSITNQISSGDGLRIHAINYLSANNVVSKRTTFTYRGGKAILPLSFYRSYNLNSILLDNSGNLQEVNYHIDELNAKGFFTTNSLGSVNGVGYDTVISQDVDANNVSNGRVETYFNNNPDIISNSANGSSQLSASLPAIKQRNVPENGTIKTIMTYDRNNFLLRRIDNTYTTNISSLYYGARIFSYSSMYGAGGPMGSNYWAPITQTLIGYYPVYDIKSLLTTRVTTEYAGSDSLVTHEGFSYDSNDQLSSTSKYTPSYYEGMEYEHPYTNVYYSDAASQTALMNAHRLSEIVLVHKNNGKYPWQTSLAQSIVKHYSVAGNGAVVENSLVRNKNLLVQQPIPDSATYDKYDSAYANLQQFTDKYLSNSLIWDYQGEYVIAEVKNATQSNIAYTSFEADGSGNWTITSASRDTLNSITGSKSYNLTNGNCIRSGLTSSSSYIVSYWSKTGSSFVISGSTAVKQGKTITINGGTWTYFEHTVTGVSSVSVSGSGDIDELRLYPSNAQMTSYTYSPLIGMTSQCDAQNRIFYYFYDAAGRLKYLKDQDGNIIKTYDYHYTAQ